MTDRHFVRPQRDMTATSDGTMRRTATLAAMWVFLCLAGCQDPNIGIVKGTIKVDGVPAKEGYIAFFPEDGRSSTAGGEIVDGQYEAEVSVGPSRVEIRVPKVVGQTKLYDTPDSEVKSIMAETLPPQFNDQSTLVLDVVAGENIKEYDLSTQPGRP